MTYMYYDITYDCLLYFQLIFEGKRLSSAGGSDFALDDIIIPETLCLDVPLYPESAFSTAAG